MKYITMKITQKISVLVNKHSSQNDLIDFVQDKKNIEKATEGSMQKRIDLIDRVTLRKRNA